MGAELEQIERFSGGIPGTKQSARHLRFLSGLRWCATALGLRSCSACRQVVFFPFDIVVTDSQSARRLQRVLRTHDSLWFHVVAFS